MKVKDSILQRNKECYICGGDWNLHKHHIFYGTCLRKISDQKGCWVWLCAEHHNMSDNSVHFNRAMDLELKAECQRAYEETHSHEEYMATFGRNYR